MSAKPAKWAGWSPKDFSEFSGERLPLVIYSVILENGRFGAAA
jgi:hypothetical protein